MNNCEPPPDCFFGSDFLATILAPTEFEIISLNDAFLCPLGRVRNTMLYELGVWVYTSVVSQQWKPLLWRPCLRHSWAGLLQPNNAPHPDRSRSCLWAPHASQHHLLPGYEWFALQSEILAEWIPKTFFCVTEMRFSKKIIPKQFSHVFLWVTNEYV